MEINILILFKYLLNML